MYSNSESTASNALGCLLALLALPITLIEQGWVLSLMWKWFIVPQFGVRPLSIGYAIGLSCVVSTLTTKYRDTETPESEEDEPVLKRALTVVFKVLLTPLAALLFAYIVHLFVH